VPLNEVLRRLIEVEPPVPSAEIEQRVEVGVEARFHDPPDKDVMIAAVVHGITLAFEHAE
jgi:hypothetical protein